MVPNEQVPVLEQIADFLLDPLLRRAARRAAFEPGRPRANLGAPAFKSLRSLATAERTALVTSRRTWNVQS